MCRNCILVLFLPFYLNLHTDIQRSKLPFTIVLLEQMKQTTPLVSCQYVLNHGKFSAGLSSLARIISKISPAFASGSLNLSIILPFSKLMEQELRHHIVLNCLQSTFDVEQLPIHFLRVSRRN